MDLEGVKKFIVGWLTEYLENAGSKGFVIGVSGGVDSALTSTLVALTGYPVMCVEMPIHQSPAQVNRAVQHIKWLQRKFENVSCINVDLSNVFDSFLAQLPQAQDSDYREMALVNTRARLRMSTLYYFAGLHKYLVAGTGNKVEDFGVGFYTKYGDGGVDISPIADLLKTEVYALSEHLGITDDILGAPPTDGLWGDERTDEDQIGASYPELEWAMAQHEEGKTPRGFSGRKREVFEIYNRLHTANLHKMQPIPICNIPLHLKKL